jgi:hypothetical protein
MLIGKVAAPLAVGMAFILGATGFTARASAADMPVKAPPPPASPWVFDVHGGVDFNFANTRVTGGGLLLYPTNSLLVQPSISVDLDIYKNKSTFINSFSVFGGVWNEDYTDPSGFQTLFRHWQEMDWWAGVNVGFAEHWAVSAQHLEFAFPWDGTISNDVFKLSFDDSYWGFPITINPYFQVFYTNDGGSTVILGKRAGTERFEAGIVPTYDFSKPYGVPLTVTVPTWVEFGPTSFWNRNDGTTNICGATGTAPCALSNWGYFSTGLQGKYSLASVVPQRLGTWYVKGGVQYYHIMNDALLAAQGTGGVAPLAAETAYGGTAVVTGFSSAKPDIAVFSGGFGFTF